MNIENEVLPCPFCGSNDISDGEVLTEYPSGRVTKQSMCRNCMALGAEAVLDKDEVDYGCVKSIAAWNTRQQLAQQTSVDVLVEALRKLSSGEYGTAKMDQCKHGLYGYEECGECVSDIALEALAAYEAKPITANEDVK